MDANAVPLIEASVVCEKFVALHPRRMTASTLLADKGSKVFLLASTSFILCHFQLQSPICPWGQTSDNL